MSQRPLRRSPDDISKTLAALPSNLAPELHYHLVEIDPVASAHGDHRPFLSAKAYARPTRLSIGVAPKTMAFISQKIWAAHEDTPLSRRAERR